MLYLHEIRDWLKSFDAADNYYIGKLDAKKERSLGVYQSNGSYAPVVALGRLEAYEIKRISLLLHWNKNARETEQAAYTLYKKLDNLRGSFLLGNTLIYFIRLSTSEPIDVGTDESGVYERVIWIDFYYQKNKEDE